MDKKLTLLRDKYRYSWILLTELVKTDFKLRYQGSILGMAWSVLKPLMLFAVMYVVFVRFLRFGEGIPHFAVSLLLAQTLWSFFQESTSQGMRAIVDRGDLLRKINLPKYIVVISSTISALINLLISLVVVFVFMVINGVEFRVSGLVFPLLILELYAFALANALLLSTLYVKFRDIGHIWDVIMQVWFYATPIIYPLSLIISYGWMFAAKVLMVINPVAQIIQDSRYVLVTEQTETVWNVIGADKFHIQIIPLVTVFVVLVAGIIVFRKYSRGFAEEL